MAKLAPNTARRKPQRSARATSAPSAIAESDAPEPDLKEALDLAMQLMAIEGVSGREGEVARFVTDWLREAGAPADAIVSDQAHRKTPLAGEVGNLILKLPGTRGGDRRLLMAHMDTVPICVGAKPVRRGEWVVSSNEASGLGGDDRAGVAVVLSAALTILRQKLPHPPLTFFWAIQEEVGLFGARYVQHALLGKPKLAFNWDGGPAEKMAIGATGGYRLDIQVGGRASHAGAAPEQGISAIAIASLAIAELVEEGWHGKIVKGRRQGTSNVGVFHGGEATNVVTDKVELKAEARSHDSKFRAQIVRAIERAFQRAARRVKSSDGVSGKVKFEGRLDYESFRLADDEPCVLAAEAAIRSIGLAPFSNVSNGGLDANWMTAHGIPTVTLGCGQDNIHTASERLHVPAFEQACRIALRLATGM
jgi:tripeptide aminopeptidase